jgi:type II secretory pathway pseudopilin PulG
MLVAIAVIGIIASIAINFLSSPQRQAIIDTTHRQNAKNIVSMASCAQAAGATVIDPAGLEATVRKLRIGINPRKGALASTRFVVTGISDEALPGVLRFLEIKNNQLVYKEQ